MHTDWVPLSEIMYRPFPNSWRRYPFPGSTVGPLAKSGTSRYLPMRTPIGAIRGMLGYGLPGVPGSSDWAKTGAQARATQTSENLDESQIFMDSLSNHTAYETVMVPPAAYRADSQRPR